MVGVETLFDSASGRSGAGASDVRVALCVNMDCNNFVFAVIFACSSFDR